MLNWSQLASAVGNAAYRYMRGPAAAPRYKPNFGEAITRFALHPGEWVRGASYAAPCLQI